MQTSASTAAVLQVLDDDTDPMCSVCRHPQQAHDAIATRYCDATLAMAFTRGCVCKVARSAE